MGRLTVRHRILLGLAVLIMAWGGLVAGTVALHKMQRQRLETVDRHLAMAGQLQRLQEEATATLRPLNRYADTRRAGLEDSFEARITAYEEAVAALRARPELGRAVEKELTTLHGLAQDIRASGQSVFRASDGPTIRSLVAVTRSYVYLARDKGSRVERLLRLQAGEASQAAQGWARRGTLGLLAGSALALLLVLPGTYWLLNGIRRRLVAHGRAAEEAAEELELPEDPFPQQEALERARTLRAEARHGAGELVPILEGLSDPVSGPSRPGGNLAGARDALETVAAEARALVDAPPEGGGAGVAGAARRLQDLAETAQVALQETAGPAPSPEESLRDHAKEAGQALARVAEGIGELQQQLEARSPEGSGERAERLRLLAAELRAEA